MNIKYLIEADDSPIRKTLAKLNKDIAAAENKAMKSVIAATEAGKKKQKEVLSVMNQQEDAINKQTAAIRRRNAEDAKAPVRKTIVSDSTAEVAAYQKSKEIRYGPVVKGTSQQDLINQFKQLEVEQVKITANYEAGRMSAASYGQVIDALSKKQAELRTAIETYGQAQVVASTKTEVANKPLTLQQGLIQKLTSQLKTYKEQRAKLTAVEVAETDKLALLNERIAETTTQLKRLDNIGKAGFDELGNKIAGTTGQIERLNAISKNYTLMANSEKDIAKITVFNAKAQQASDAAQRLSNIGRKGFDEMGNAVKGSTNYIGKAWGALRKLSYILPGVGIAGLLAFAIDPIVNYISQLDIFKKKISESIKWKKEFSDITLKGSQDAQKELTNLKLLYAQYRNNNLSLKDRKSAYDQLQKLYPSYFGNIAFEQTASAKTKAAYNDLTTSILATAKARSYADKITENSTRQLNNDQKIKDLEAEKLEIQRKQAVVVRGTAGGANIYASYQKKVNDIISQQNNLRTDSEILTKRNLDLEKEVNEEVKKGGKITGGIGGDNLVSAEKQYQSALAKRTDIINKIKAAQADADGKAKSQEDQEIAANTQKFAALRNDLIEYNKWATNYNKTHKQKVDLVDTSQIEPIRKQAETNIKATRSVLQTQVETEQMKQIYSQYEDYKTEYGKKAADARYSQEMKGYDSYVDYVEGKITELSGKNDVASVKQLDFYNKELPKAKKRADDQEFDQLMKALKSSETLQDNLAKINEDYNRKRAILNDKYRGADLEAAEKVLKEQRDAAINSAQAEAADKLAIMQEGGQRIIEMSRSQIQAYIKTLESLDKSKLTDDQQKQLETDINRLRVAMQGVNEPAKLYDQQQRQHIENLKEQLKLLTPYSEKWQEIVNEITDSNAELEKSKSTRLDNSLGDLTNGANTTDMINGDFGGVAAGAAEAGAIAGVAKGIIGDIQESLSGLDDNLDYTIGQIGEMVGILGQAADGAANLAAGIASGNPLLIINGVISLGKAVAGVFKIGKKVKQMNAQARAEVQKFYDDAIKGEMDYQSLLRKRELDSAARGKNSYNAIIAQLDAIKKQSPELQKAYDKVYASLQGGEYKEGEGYKHGTWLRKAKTWDIMASLAGSNYKQLEDLDAQGKLIGDEKTNFDQLKALKEEMDAAGVSAEDLQESLRQLLTGTSTSGLADSLDDLFENGKRSAQDFGDSFEEIMKNSLMNTFKAKYLEDALQPFYEELAAMMEEGTPTEDQIAALKAKYVAIGENADAYLANVEKITGEDLSSGSDTSTSSNSLQGAYSAASQESISLLAGQTAGMRLAQLDTNKILGTHTPILKQQLDIAMQGIMYQQQIAANTLRTADNTVRLLTIEQSLKSIDSKMSNSSNVAAAAGIKGGL